MAIGIGGYTNVDTSDPTNYPEGQIKDDALGINGTPVSVQTYGDIQQFFYKILDAAGIVPNGLPDNVTNDYQYYKAMNAFMNSYAGVIIEYIIGSTYDPTKCYVLSGLTSEVTDGYIFFDGELMYCSGRSGPACGGGLVAVLNRSTDVINMLTTAAIACGTAGTGDICDYADVVFLREGWTNASIGGGWTNGGGNAVQYRKVSANEVNIRGTVSSGTSTPNPIFTLPVGYRPSLPLAIPVFGQDGGGVMGAFVKISTAGVVDINVIGATYSTVPDNTAFILNNISFSLI